MPGAGGYNSGSVEMHPPSLHRRTFAWKSHKHEYRSAVEREVAERIEGRMSTYYGYGPDQHESWLTPPSPVIKRLLIANGVVFACQILVVLLAGKEVYIGTVQRFLALSGEGLRSWMVWQVGTYMFLHDPWSLFHILINALFLWMFGREVEYEIGPRRFLKLYLVGGAVGGLLWVAFNFNRPYPVLGASGATWAVCFAYATLWPDRPLRFFFLITMKCKHWAILALVIELYYSLMITSFVANLAHLGGMGFGYLFIKWLGYGHMPSWIEAIQRALPAGRNRALNPNDEYHSSRPGVAHNHPYRSFEEQTVERPAKKKGVFGRFFSSSSQAPTPSAEADYDDKEEYIRKEIDPILEKISKHGMHSLTKQERQILEAAREKMGRRR